MPPRVAQELLRHAPGSKVTMERYAHVTGGQQRIAADLLDGVMVGPELTVTVTVTDPCTGSSGVVRGSP